MAMSVAAKAILTSPQAQKCYKYILITIGVFMILICSMCSGVAYIQQTATEVSTYFKDTLSSKYIPNLARVSSAVDTKFIYASYIVLFYNTVQGDNNIKNTSDRLLKCFFSEYEQTTMDNQGNEVKEQKYRVISDADRVFTKIAVEFQIEITEEQKMDILQLKESLGTITGFGNGGKLSEFALQFVGEGHNRFTSYSSPNGSGFGDNWCAMFVSYCTDQMGYIDAGYIHYFVGCTSSGILQFRSEGRFEESAAHGGTYQPQPGDIIFFNWSGGNSSADHVGIVTGMDGNVIHTVEGNCGNDWSTSTVKEKAYEYSSSYIVGYMPLSQYIEGSNSFAATSNAP